MLLRKLAIFANIVHNITNPNENSYFYTSINHCIQRESFPKKDDKVLDIGCGGGQTTFEVSEMVGENGYVLGADISKILLDLAKTQKVNLAEISITLLADQFLRFIKDNQNLNLETASEFLLMATWLAYLKSKLYIIPIK